MSHREIMILTANRLADGVVVYLADGDGWVEDISAAQLALDAEETAGLEQVGATAVNCQAVVAPCLIEVEFDGEYVRPLSVRERIRAAHRTTLAFHQERETAATTVTPAPALSAPHRAALTERAA